MLDQTIPMPDLGANYQLRITETKVCKADEHDKEMRKFPENSKPLSPDTTRHLADLLHGGHRMRSYRIESPLAAELKNDTQQCIDFITQLEQHAQKKIPTHAATQSVGGVNH